MPPSGFNRTQAQHIGDFLSSCANALASEADMKKIDYGIALEREIVTIKQHMAKPDCGETIKGTLMVVANFYYQVRFNYLMGLAVVSEDAYFRAVADAVGEVKHVIEALKVDENVPA